MLFPALPGLLLIASGYGIAEQTLLGVPYYNDQHL